VVLASHRNLLAMPRANDHGNGLFRDSVLNDRLLDLSVVEVACFRSHARSGESSILPYCGTVVVARSLRYIASSTPADIFEVDRD
jgi:hypothetical protein